MYDEILTRRNLSLYCLTLPLRILVTDVYKKPLHQKLILIQHFYQTFFTVFVGS
jgi:hypothetical protein